MCIEEEGVACGWESEDPEIRTGAGLGGWAGPRVLGGLADVMSRGTWKGSDALRCVFLSHLLFVAPLQPRG